MTDRILVKHFSNIRDRIKKYGEHVGIAEHGDVKGLAREGIIKEFLKQNLPSIVEFKTGQIIDHNDELSGQLDIIFQSPFAPHINLFQDIQLTMADATLGVMEVKSNLFLFGPEILPNH